MTDFQRTDCGCRTSGNSRVNEIYRHLTLADAPLAMAYVPYQHWDKTYSLCKGLQAGTIFPELDKPFCGKGGKCR